MAFFLASFFLLPIMANLALAYFLVGGAAAAIVAWRLVPVYVLKVRIREMGNMFDQALDSLEISPQKSS
jgi:Flp pilus assembly protein TadB